MLQKEEQYRGLLIDTNIDERFYNEPKYYTVVNPDIKTEKGNPHVHCRHKTDTTKIVDCFQAIKTGKWNLMNKYKPNHRMLAMILLGYNFKDNNIKIT
jgi:heat shock protein HspQ